MAVALATGVVLCTSGVIAPAAFAGDASGYSDEDDSVANLDYWMSALPDDVKLSELSIPGTHDSATSTVTNDFPRFAETQTMTLREQLDSGIRELDIRAAVRVNDNKLASDDYFTIHHNAYDINEPGTDRQMTGDDVMTAVCGFLSDNPRETVLVQWGDLDLVDDEWDEVDPDSDLTEDERNALVDSTYSAALRLQIERFEDQGCVWDQGGSTTVPTLGQVRGKLVLIPQAMGAGGWGGSADLDEFGLWSALFSGGRAPVGGDAVDTLYNIPEYTEKLVGNIKAADADTDKEHIYVTGLNANTGAKPHSFANGVDGIGAIGYEGQGINELMVEWMLGLRKIDGDRGLSVSKLGIVAMDYPGASLIETIIAYNYPLISDIGILQSMASEAFVWWGIQINNEVDEISPGDADAAKRWEAMQKILDHFLPSYPMIGWVLHDRDRQISWDTGGDGLYLDSKWDEDFRYMFLSTHGRPGNAAGNNKAIVKDLLTQLSGANAAARSYYLQKEISLIYPGRTVAVLVKQSPGGYDNWMYTSPETARYDQDGFLHVVWVYDAPAPPVLELGGPYDVNEGDTITLRAGASTDPDGRPITYCWATSGGVCASGPTLDVRFVDNNTKTWTVNANNGVAQTSQDVTVRFNNVAPTVTDVRIDSPKVENGVAILRGTLIDPGTGDSHTLVVDWGDGQHSRAEIPARGASAAAHFPLPGLQHVYLDDGPSGNPSYTYPVHVTVTDDDGGIGEADADARVDNVAPTVSDLSVTPAVDENGLATVTGTIYDIGSLDTHTVTVDWGDGHQSHADVPAHLESAPFAPLPDLTHQYLDDPAGASSDEYTVTVNVTDDDGGEWEDTAPVRVDNIAPTVSDLSVTPVDEDGVATLTGTLSDPGMLDTHTVTVDWGDGSDPEGHELDAGQGLPDLTHQYLDDPSGTTDDYTVNVSVSDDDGGASEAAAVPAEVSNVAPTVTDLAVIPVDENGVATLTGTLADPGTLDTHTVTVDWGDGTGPEGHELDAGEGLPELTHRYLDDDPTETASDEYTVTVTVTDDDGGEGEGTATARVDNVAPAVLDLAVTPVAENAVATLTGTLSDPGTLDTHTVTVDWGDGSDSESHELAGGDGLPELTHRYLDDNPTGTPTDQYTVTVTVTDDDGGAWEDAVTVHVDNVAPVVTFGTIRDSSGYTVGAAPPSDLDVALLGLEIDAIATFADPGTQDTHTSSIDWGDGTVNPTQGSSPISASHRYLTTGERTVTITVTDDDTGVGTATASITVVDAAGAIRILAAHLQGIVDDPTAPAATRDAAASALTVLVGNNPAKTGGALNDLTAVAKNNFFVKLRTAAATLEGAALHREANLVALIAKSVIVLEIDQSATHATTDRQTRAVAEARADVAAGDAATTAAEAIEHYRTALIHLRPAL